MLTYMGRRFRSNASSHAFHQLGGIPLKYIGWQADSTQCAQFGDFAESTLDTDRTGVEAQQAEWQFFLFFSLCNWFSHEQSIQVLLHLGREACQDDGVDLRFVCQQPPVDQRRYIVWSFDPTGAALGMNQLTQTLRMLFVRKNLGAEPVL
jgi:hypothetical protein